MRNTKGLLSTLSLTLSVIFVMAFLSGCPKGQNPQATGEIKTAAADGASLSFTTEYQAVFMDNGQVFFGRLQNAGSTYPVLTDVFYIRQQVNQETKQVNNILIRRGSEWHSPDKMYINASHIAVIEPVSPNSQVAKLIGEAKTQKAPAAQ